LAEAVLPGPARPAAPRVELVTRANCHLCQEAEATLARLAPELGFEWRAVDVDGDAERQDRYGDRVPVVLIDGREHGYWRIEEQRFRAAISG
jgi:glutaredoxin